MHKSCGLQAFRLLESCCISPAEGLYYKIDIGLAIIHNEALGTQSRSHPQFHTCSISRAIKSSHGYQWHVNKYSVFWRLVSQSGNTMLVSWIFHVVVMKCYELTIFWLEAWWYPKSKPRKAIWQYLQSNLLQEHAMTLKKSPFPESKATASAHFQGETAAPAGVFEGWNESVCQSYK